MQKDFFLNPIACSYATSRLHITEYLGHMQSISCTTVVLFLRLFYGRVREITNIFIDDQRQSFTLFATARFFGATVLSHSQRTPRRKMGRTNRAIGIAAHSRREFRSIRESNVIAPSNPVQVSLLEDA
jgi:hypothetical protein